jgi:hypothetical protein
MFQAISGVVTAIIGAGLMYKGSWVIGIVVLLVGVGIANAVRFGRRFSLSYRDTSQDYLDWGCGWGGSAGSSDCGSSSASGGGDCGCGDGGGGGD